MKLRQVALAATDLTDTRAKLFLLLGINEDFADAGVGEFGLVNSVMAIGDTFLEIVSPNAPATAAGRTLDRYETEDQPDGILVASKGGRRLADPMPSPGTGRRTSGS